MKASESENMNFQKRFKRNKRIYTLGLGLL